MSLCEINCSYSGYTKETKKAGCKCKISSKDLIISEIMDNKTILSNNFTNQGSSSSNMITMKCIYTLFTKEGISNNIGNYILIFMTTLFVILGILFNKCGRTKKRYQ